MALRAGSPGWAEGCTPGRPPAPHDCRSSGVWGCREPGILVPVGQLGSSHWLHCPVQLGDPGRSRGQRPSSYQGRGPTAGVLGSGWTFLGLPPGPFGRGHLRWNQACHSSRCNLGHPFLSLSWAGASCWGRAPCFGASPSTASRSLGLWLLWGEEGRQGSSDSRPSPAANSGAAEPGQGKPRQRQGPARPSPPSRGPDFRKQQSP